MKPSEIIRDLIGQDKSYSGKSKTFMPGQIINGKITKLFPNQTAEVQLGSHKAIAHLEMSLSANSRYWFKVQPGDGVLRLKVMDSGGLAKRESPIESLLSQLGLSASKEHKMLVQFFLKEQLPITADTMLLVSDLLKDGEPLEGLLRAVKELMVRQLPFTKEVVLSLSTALDGEPLTDLMGNLIEKLKQNELSPRGQKVSSLLNELSKTIREKSGQAAAEKLASAWLFPKNEANSQAAFNIMKAFKLVAEHASETIELQKAIDGLSLHSNSPIKPLIGDALKELLQSNQTGSRQELILSLAKIGRMIGGTQGFPSQTQILNEIQRMLIHARIGRLSIPVEENRILPLIKGVLLIKRDVDLTVSGVGLSSIFGESKLKQASVNLGSYLAGETGLLEARLQTQERTLLSDLKTSIQTDTPLRYDQQNIKSHLKILIHTLGLSYEHDLAKFPEMPGDEAAGKLNMLKPLLIGLLNEELPFSVKDAAERLLHKITGFQALSQETGPQQHLVLQLPVALWGKVTDLTMQWSGRKTDKGEIDPSYCRVLFYLNLEYLQETMVDIHIQNRVMNISVINGHESLKPLSAPLIAKLRENLDKLNYKLSSVTFQKPDKDGSSMAKRKPITFVGQPSHFTGVDLKI